MSHVKCVLCQSLLRPFGPRGRLHHRCPQCGWIILDKVHHLSEEKQKERYLQHENSLENTGYVDMLENFIEIGVLPFAQKNQRVLDFGCGPEPVLAQLLRKKGFTVDLYDPFFNTDKANLNQHYQLITLTEVLEHISNPLEALLILTRRLERGGAIVLMTLFHPDNQEKFESWWYRRDPTHVSFYTLATLRQLAEALGLSLVFSDGQRIAVLRNT